MDQSGASRQEATGDHLFSGRVHDQRTQTRELQGPCDEMLALFLGCTEEEASQRLLGELLGCYAEPVVTRVIKSKLGHFLGCHSRAIQGQDVEDVSSEATVRVMKRLRDLKTGICKDSIRDLQNYVAVICCHVCDEFLGQRSPNRLRLKNRIRYALTHRKGFALWKSADGQWLAGFGAWREAKRRPSGRIALLTGETETLEKLPSSHEKIQTKELVELLNVVFKDAGGPIKLEDLISMMFGLMGLSEFQEEVDFEERDTRTLLGHVQDHDVSVDIKIEQREDLQHLWLEISRLALQQRTALLLNLRDDQGRSAMDFFERAGIASIRQISDTLEISHLDFAILWDCLPIEDAQIAELLALTRQQVINLRKSARQRLARRMEGLTHEGQVCGGCAPIPQWRGSGANELFNFHPAPGRFRFSAFFRLDRDPQIVI